MTKSNFITAFSGTNDALTCGGVAEAGLASDHENYCVDAACRIYTMTTFLFNLTLKRATLLMCGLLFAATMTAQTQTQIQGTDLFWEISGITLTISGSGTIPDYGTTSTTRPPWYGASFTAINIGSGVTVIGNNAFRDCIGLTSVTIPANVTTIGQNAFRDNSYLKTLTIEDGNNLLALRGASGGVGYEEPQGSFYGCPIETLHWGRNLTVTYQNSNNNRDVFGTSIEQVTFGNSVTNINANAFMDCGNLTHINIPNHITSIGANAFNGCGLTSLTIPSSLTTIGNDAFRNIGSFSSLNIPNTVNTIGQNAFRDNSYLTTLTIEDGNNLLALLGASGGVGYEEPQGSFYGCPVETLHWGRNLTVTYQNSNNNRDVFGTSIEQVTFGNNVTNINANAFMGCGNLTHINIPNHITSIGANAFNGCTALLSLTVNWTDPITVTGNVFTSVQQRFVNLVVPQGTVATYKNRVVWQDFYFNGDPLPSGTLTGGLAWTYDLNGTLAISGTGNMPDYNATNPPWNEFRHKIHSLVIQNDVNTIGQRAFENYPNLRKVSIANGTTALTMNNYVSGNNFSPFHDSPIEEVYIGRNVIRNNAFAWGLFGTGLKQLEIGNAVNEIAGFSFRDCLKLTEVINHAATPQSIEDDVFLNVNKDAATLRVLAVYTYSTANVWKDFGTISIIPVITITSQPTEITDVSEGSISEILSVSASVTPNATITYQWYSSTTNSNADGTAIIGATSANYTMPPSLTAGTYYYFCEVRVVGALPVRSNVAYVNVWRLTISGQPAATTNLTAGCITGNLTVSASVTPNATLAYQWYNNTTDCNTGGTIIIGATDASYTIPTTHTAVGSPYYYFCEVSIVGVSISTRSNVAPVNVSAPVITIGTQPAPTTNVIAGSISGNLSVTADVNCGTVTYQWYSTTTNSNIDGTVISGATAASYQIPTTLTAETYYYFVEVRATGATSVRSNAATVTVTSQPVTSAPELLITTNPLRAYVRNELLHITGIAVDETLSIYTLSGVLVHQSKPNSAEIDINLTTQGVYIIRSGGNTVRVVVQ